MVFCNDLSLKFIQSISKNMFDSIQSRNEFIQHLKSMEDFDLKSETAE